MNKINQIKRDFLEYFQVVLHNKINHSKLHNSRHLVIGELLKQYNSASNLDQLIIILFNKYLKENNLSYQINRKNLLIELNHEIQSIIINIIFI